MPISLEMRLSGTLRLSDETGKRTRGGFRRLINDNAPIFERYFGVKLFPGSLNVDVRNPPALQRQLDAGKPVPHIIIPRTELINMPEYIGDGQAWACRLNSAKLPEAIECWIFRRKDSRVPPGVIEILAREPLTQPFDLKHGDAVTIEVCSLSI